MNVQSFLRQKVYIKDEVTMSRIKMVLATKKVRKPSTSQYSQQRLKKQSIDESKMETKFPETFLKRTNSPKTTARGISPDYHCFRS